MVDVNKHRKVGVQYEMFTLKIIFDMKRKDPIEKSNIVYDLKSVGPLEFKLVAPMPEQLKTTAVHFYEVSRKPY